MTRLQRLGLAAAVTLLATATASGQTDVPESAGHVYTNADLERLEPLPVTGEPCEVAERCDPGGWDFVIDFIQRERARIEANRRFELEHRRLDVEAERNPGHSVPYPGFLYGPPYHRLHRYPRLPHVTRDAPAARPPSPTRVPHWRFRDNPPVREHVPGLGDSYRGHVRTP